MIILPVVLGGINIGFQTRFLDGSAKYHSTGNISYVLFGEDGPSSVYYFYEGAYDVMGAQAKGRKAVCALQGLNISKRQAARLARLTSHVIIVPDPDPAGLKAAPINAKKLQKIGIHAEIEWPR